MRNKRLKQMYRQVLKNKIGCGGVYLTRDNRIVAVDHPEYLASFIKLGVVSIKGDEL